MLQQNDPRACSRGIAVNRTYLDQSGSISARNDKESRSFIRDSGLCGKGRMGVFVVVCCLLPTWTGCLHLPVRHGMILKGDWSLEMNRIPWLKGRDNVYQEPSECGVGQGMCAAEIDSPFATGVASSTPVMARCGPAGCGSAVHGQSAVEPQPHARFHPVPTRSAFSATPNFAPMMNAPMGPMALPPAESAPERLQPPPLPTETQVIPTPGPRSPEVPNSQTAVEGETASQQVSWIFHPATVGIDSLPDGN